ncbi:MAG: hypothetical protein P4L53_20475 [Candidatus Obscuribacterales bacterium]|nr:hypothetical protein [Candidatus Obscuribacterales bacterium]
MAKIAPAVLLSSLIILSSQFQAANGQSGIVSESSSSSSSTDKVIKGYAFKYKERFRNYAGQIDNAQTKGWLNAEKASQYKDRLEQLKAQEASAGKKGYPKSDVDALDQAVTKFNMDLTNSEQKQSR